jgi:hypothetical protein
MNQDGMQRLSMTPTVSRQTQSKEFGQVMKETVEAVGSVGGALSGALLNAVPGGPVMSAAARSVTAAAAVTSGGSTRTFASTTGEARAAINAEYADVGGGRGGGGGGSNGTSVQSGSPEEFNHMVDIMRAESERSMRMQMEMQQESRDYNMVTNVLKVRHDSAKSAINNIR